MPSAKYVPGPADESIFSCIEGTAERNSYYLLAGAGSGKTGALVFAVERYLQRYERRLRDTGKRIGIITYTNAATDEISHRLGFNQMVSVSTIHSFCWSLISGHDHDIRSWMKDHLAQSIAELNEQQRKGRANSAIYQTRAQDLIHKQERLSQIDTIKRFVYNPSGSNAGRNALTHSDVLQVAADFITSRPSMATILSSRYPILMIDECQDTNSGIMTALLKIEEEYKGRWSLGLFGDVMQKIYTDGVPNLIERLPDRWVKPKITVNHRCGSRIVELINQIRKPSDDYVQTSAADRGVGCVRLFLAPRVTASKVQCEADIAVRMATIAADSKWADGQSQYKTLILEHRMAAARMGFLALYNAFHSYDGFKTGLVDGTIPGLSLFLKQVLPLVLAHRARNEFEVSRIVREWSPLLSKDILKKERGDTALTLVRSAVASVVSLWDSGGTPVVAAVLRAINSTGLFEIPEDLVSLAGLAETELTSIATEAKAGKSRSDDKRAAWSAFLLVGFHEVEIYAKHLAGLGPFGTHQGVKGLEYQRVMVVIDDEEAGGFLFSYDKLSGLVDLSDKDRENAITGKDTAIARTRRLLYVTCSRARDSLAVVYYATTPESAKKLILSSGWFRNDEIIVV